MAARTPHVCTLLVRGRHGCGPCRVPPAQQRRVPPEPRTVGHGLVKVVSTVAAGWYLGDEVGNVLKHFLMTELDLPEPEVEISPGNVSSF